jgi:chromosomal replication initiator protein
MNEILDQLKQKIRNKISELNYSTWFEPISSAQVQDGVLTLTVPNRFVADWIRDYYEDIIFAETLGLTGQRIRLSFNILPAPEEPQRQPQKPAPEQRDSVERERTQDQLNPKYTFDRFVVGSSNQFAHAASKAVCDLPGGHYNPLFIYGGVGLGKTHLLHAIGLELSQKHQNLNIIAVNSESFVNELINSIRYERMPEFRRKYRENCDVLLIDDVQFIAGKERSQDELFHTFNALHDSQRQIVVTSDKFPKDIPGLEERLRSRFEWGLIADIQPPDLETRVAILKKKAEQNRLKCPDDVAMFIASSIKSNVRELEGSLIRINAFASLANAPITVDFVREVLSNLIREKEHRLSIESVQKAVANHFKIGVSDLKSPRRIRTLAHPRQIAMYLCKKHTQTSYPEIGGKFGGKDHTTVMHAVRKIERLLKEDNHLASDIATIERGLIR